MMTVSHCYLKLLLPQYFDIVTELWSMETATATAAATTSTVTIMTRVTTHLVAVEDLAARVSPSSSTTSKSKISDTCNNSNTNSF